MDRRPTYKTSNYDQFHFLRENREIDFKHLDDLVESIKEKNLLHLYPIVVTPEFEVMDGQHRLYAAIELQVPIYYKVTNDMTVRDVARTNTATKSWGLSDYLNYWCERGSTEHLIIRSYLEKYPWMTITNTIGLFCGSGPSASPRRRRDFKGGTLNITDAEYPYVFADRLEALSEYCDFYAHRSFVVAMHRLFTHPDYDHDNLLMKLKYMSRQFVKCPDIDTYIEMIEEIYNYRKRGEYVTFRE